MQKTITFKTVSTSSGFSCSNAEEDFAEWLKKNQNVEILNVFENSIDPLPGNPLYSGEHRIKTVIYKEIKEA